MAIINFIVILYGLSGFLVFHRETSLALPPAFDGIKFGPERISRYLIFHIDITNLKKTTPHLIMYLKRLGGIL